METNLKFKIIFKLHEKGPDLTAANLQFQAFFHNCHEGKKINYVVCDSKPVKIIQDLIYEEPVYEIGYTVDYKAGFSDFQGFHKVICKEWCNQSVKHCYQLLKPLRSGLHGKLKQSHTDIRTLEFAFGTLPDLRHFVIHYQYTPASHISEIMSSYYHSKRFFNLYFCLSHERHCDHLKTTHRFEVQYSSIVHVYIDISAKSKHVNVYLHLSHMPPVYMKIRKRNLGAEDNIASDPHNKTPDTMPYDRDYQLSKWERSLDFGCDCKQSQCCVERVGKALVLKIVIPQNDRSLDVIRRLQQRCHENTEFVYARVENVSLHMLGDFENFSFLQNKFLQENGEEFHQLLFNCQYSWEALLSRSYDVHDQVNLAVCGQSAGFWHKLQKQMLRYSQGNPHAFSSALFYIYNMMYIKNMAFNFKNALQELFAYYCDNRQIEDLPSGMCLARRAIITPSRTILLPPTEHFDNRVIRRFGVEYMLRISVQGDNFTKLTFAIPSAKRDFVERIFGCFLRRGIKIGDRVYKVLASSNSQLREHGLWMWATDNKNQVEVSDIRAWMGDFSQIRNVAKYMARMGQCFTSSEEAAQVAVSEEDEITLEDIKTDDKKYTFSDGIGMISVELANEVRTVLESRGDTNLLTDEIYKPSAFQIRYKGCKGMVAEMSFCDGIALGIRPSMKKFECDTSNNLEIVKTSAPRALFLNRSLITILEQSGVQEKVFLKLQKSAILDFTDSLLYEQKAAKIMTNMLLLDFPFKKLQMAGIRLTQEPFFRVLLLAVYKNAVDNLRSKSRIPVPPEFGRNMLGILDETKFLKYGQVFVQYSENVGNVTSPLHVLKGTVIVTKNPCMHPGDVRLFEAVDVRALHHIKDCIVFPAQGHRPHPDEMAGSDLDGDEYVVIWLPDLMFSRNFEPMDYPPSEEKKMDKDIEVDDMIDFFCDYIQNDNIGTFANAHLAWADQHKDGIFSDVCMSISRKFPYVLDFAKTGHTAYLKSSEKPRAYPDFMEKGVSSNNYRSRKSLGTLYRTSRVLEACLGKIDLKTYLSEVDHNLDYPGWEEYREWAESLCHDYNNRVSSMLDKYGIQSETEALSGYVEKVNLYSQSRNEKANAISIVKTYIVETMARFKYKFLTAFDGDAIRNIDITDTQKKRKKYQRASAWYMVAYQQKSPRILSFPWIMSDVLIEIRTTYITESGVPLGLSESSFLEVLDESLTPLLKFFEQAMVDDVCPCVIVGKNVFFEWMYRSNLNYTADKACIDCVTRIFKYFRDFSETHCCSGKQWECRCIEHCSPGKFIMSCLKFFVSNISSDLGECGSCEGFHPFNLCSLALQTYADLAITHDKRYLGFEEGDSTALRDSILDEEGDPIRIPVNDDHELQSLMTHHMEEVSELLKDMSGVREIFISGNKDLSGQWYILVNSVGRCWQRWNLEELIMSPELAKYLRQKIENGKS